MFFYIFLFFVLGLAVGSFGNVCIYRIPRDESVATPRSHCPRCNHLIPWHDNIPVLSYLVLRRRCRFCRAPISIRYPLFELVMGLLFAAVAWRYAFATMLPAYLSFVFLLVIISGIDYEHRIIPDHLSLFLLLVGIGSSFFNERLGAVWHERLIHSLAGGFTGSFLLFFFGYLGKKLFKQEAMGGGDVKMMAGVGALLGVSGTLAVIFAASLLGSIVGITLFAVKRIERRSYLPFGPFLAAGALVILFFPIDIFRFLSSL